MPLKLDAQHLSDNRQYQVQGTQHFELQIEGMGDDFTLNVTSTSLPEISNAPIEMSYGNSKVKMAGQVEYGDGSVVIKDAIIPDIEKKINDWQRKIYDPDTGKMAWIDEYKKKGTITQFGPDGTCERVWELFGCWPSTVSYGDLDSSSPDLKSINMTLTYDKAVRK